MTTVIARSITNKSGNKTFNPNISIPSFCTINNNGGLLLNGSISGSGTLMHTGSGVTQLANTNTYTGGTNIRSGTLKLSNSGCLGSGFYNKTIFINGILDYSSSVDQTIAGIVGSYATMPSSAGLVYNNNCKLIIDTSARFGIQSRWGEFNFDGTIEINNGYLRVGNNDNTSYHNGIGSGSISRVSKIIINQNGTLELYRGSLSTQTNINAIIEGNGPINLMGGSFIVSGGGSHSGTITIDPSTTWNMSKVMPNSIFVNNGTLTLTVGSIWNTNYVFNTIQNGNTTTFIHGTDYLVGTAVGSANITSRIQAAGFGGDMNDFSGFVSGNIALIQRGSPTSTPITFQTKVNNAMTAGASAVIIYNNTTGLTLPTVNANIPVIMITQTLGQQLITNLGASEVSARIDTSNIIVPFTNSITGTGTVTKTGGTGTLVLSGTNNTYTGGTIINNGTLKAGNASCFGTGTITLNAGAVLDRGGFNITNTILNNGGTIIN